MATFTSGARLGPFELLSRLGSGGMGDVWLATDRRLGRNVAIKVVGEALAADEQIRARMQREARSVSALNHPNICSLFDIGTEEGCDYLVMEYVEGQTLSDRIAAGPLSFDAMTAIAVQAVEAVKEAHAHGVTHRDLKPANIMITPNGLVKILDFGLATRARTSSDDATAVRSSAGVIVGTLAYMSPEQLTAQTADARSDIFSIGLVLYEMATGTRAFTGTPTQIAAQLLNTNPRPVRSLNPAMPQKLEKLIARCMEKSPGDRYQSAADLLFDLRNVTAGKKLAPAPKPAAKRAKFDSIAVLPFTNATGDPQLDYLSDGIAEGVLHQLSRVSSLRVLARSTTFRYRQAPDPVSVGRELKVRTVLTGEVAMRRGKVAVSAEVVDVKNGSHVWGDSYPDAEAQSVQDTIAQEAAAALDARTDARPQRTIDDEAYRLYLRGRHSLNKWTSPALHSAIRSFQEAIDRDPGFALAFAGLADAYLMFESHAESAAKGSVPKARAAALRALQIDDSIAEAHTSLAMAQFNEWNWDEAERGFQRAITLNPNYETAHYWYAMFLVTKGRKAEALDRLQRAHELDPLSAPIAAHLAAVKAMNGGTDEALQELRALAAVSGESPMIHQWLAFVHFTKGQLAEAIQAARRSIQISNDSSLGLATLGFMMGKAGHHDAAREILATLLTRDDIRPLWLAGVTSGLGDVESTLTYLEKHVYDEERSANTTYITWPPWFDAIQNEPRYVALLQYMGLR